MNDEGGRKVGTIGITAFAIEQLTDLGHEAALERIDRDLRRAVNLFSFELPEELRETA